MPFTPFHMGPGLLLKALLQGSFSLLVFGWAQIIMDIQPLVMLLTGVGALHGFSPTAPGALRLAIGAALSGKYAAEFALRSIGLSGPLPIRWPVAFSSTFIGTFSHRLLDSVMESTSTPSLLCSNLGTDVRVQFWAGNFLSDTVGSHQMDIEIDRFFAAAEDGALYTIIHRQQQIPNGTLLHPNSVRAGPSSYITAEGAALSITDGGRFEFVDTKALLCRL